VFTHLHIPEGEGRFGLDKEVPAATGDHVAKVKLPTCFIPPG
jgi:hypothetical protein